MQPITSFQGDHDFLSNFSPSEIVLDGETYPTVEHAFQAAKTRDPEERRAIREAATPRQAKRLGRKVALRPDWDQVKTDLMRGLLVQKFERTDLREELLATGEAELIEGNTWGDRVWGCVPSGGKWVGQNRLGKLLMEVRSAIRREREADGATPTGTGSP